MMNLQQKYPPLPPWKKYTPRQLLDELIRDGYRAYLCGDPGYGVVVAWAKSIYVESEGVWLPEKWAGWSIPTTGVVPDRETSMARVARALECDNIRVAPLEPSLEFLISSSVKIETGDDGELLVNPLLKLLSAKS